MPGHGARMSLSHSAWGSEVLMPKPPRASADEVEEKAASRLSRARRCADWEGGFDSTFEALGAGLARVGGQRVGTQAAINSAIQPAFVLPPAESNTAHTAAAA